MSDERTQEYEKGFKEGQQNPRGLFQTIAEGMPVPTPTSKEYRSWEKGREAGEEWRRKNPRMQKEKNKLYY